MTDARHAAPGEEDGVARRLSLLDRRLTLWMFAAMATGAHHTRHHRMIAAGRHPHGGG